MIMKILRHFALVILATLLLPSGTAQAALLTFQLNNHPAGGASAPLYGLRLDGLFTHDTKDIWSFDFDGPGSNMILTYDSSSNEIRIHGTVLGGLDVGSAYHTTLQGLWNVDFSYSANVNFATLGSDLELEVTAESPNNKGTISPLFNATGVTTASGQTVTINMGSAISLLDEQGDEQGYEQESNLFSFRFNNMEDHRLAGHGLSGPDTFVGWGWMNHSGKEHIYATDWIFTGTPTTVPLPAAVWLFGSGLLGLMGFSARLCGCNKNFTKRVTKINDA